MNCTHAQKELTDHNAEADKAVLQYWRKIFHTSTVNTNLHDFFQ
jgi:hypothetical protein